MAVSRKGKEFEIILEGGEEVLKIDANGWPYSPSLEGNPLVMVRVIDYLAEMPSISRIILNQRRNFNYSSEQTGLLVQIAAVYSYLTKQKKLLSLSQLGYGTDISNKYSTIQYVIYNLLRSDPIGAYVELTRLIREGNIRVDGIEDPAQAEDERKYIDVLQYIKNNLEKTDLITRAEKLAAPLTVISKCAMLIAPCIFSLSFSFGLTLKTLSANLHIFSYLETFLSKFSFLKISYSLEKVSPG